MAELGVTGNFHAAVAAAGLPAWLGPLVLADPSKLTVLMTVYRHKADIAKGLDELAKRDKDPPKKMSRVAKKNYKSIRGKEKEQVLFQRRRRTRREEN